MNDKEQIIEDFIKNTEIDKIYKVKFWANTGLLKRVGNHPIDGRPTFVAVKSNGDIIGSVRRYNSVTIREIEEFKLIEIKAAFEKEIDDMSDELFNSPTGSPFDLK